MASAGEIDALDGVSMVAELNKQVPVLPVYDTVPIQRYYKTAGELLRQAEMYMEESDMERAYVMYNKFATFVLKTIGNHASYKSAQFKQEKVEHRKKCEDALTKCETLKKQIVEKYDAEYEASAAAALEALKLGTSPSAPPADAEESSMQRQSTWDNLTLPVVKTVAAGKGEEKSALYPSLNTSNDGPSAAAVRAGAALPGQVIKKPAPAPATKAKTIKMFTLRPVQLNAKIMDEFLKYASSNTKKNIETCGILCGQIKSNVLVITAVILPKQKATSDTCVTESEEEMIGLQDKHNLLTIGWIHTHPSQTCFLSSIDLHTHFSYQIMMPEAIAIVMAPSKVPNRGVFHVTPEGLDGLKDCGRSGFHQHANSDTLWGPVSHVNIDSSKTAPAYKFHDLR